MVIKMAVKDTPTLLGNKLKQYYYRGDNYFELDVDVGSSSVARCAVCHAFSSPSLPLPLSPSPPLFLSSSTNREFFSPPPPTRPTPQASGRTGHRLLQDHRGGHGPMPARQRRVRAARGCLRRLQVPAGRHERPCVQTAPVSPGLGPNSTTPPVFPPHKRTTIMNDSLFSLPKQNKYQRRRLMAFCLASNMLRAP